jgi:hypothetical protein
MKKAAQEKTGLEMADILKMCICGTCPSYIDCSAQGKSAELAFC